MRFNLLLELAECFLRAGRRTGVASRGSKGSHLVLGVNGGKCQRQWRLEGYRWEKLLDSRFSRLLESFQLKTKISSIFCGSL